MPAPTPRIDLDGVALLDAREPAGTALAIFRHRTTAGVTLLMPESAEFTVPWAAIAGASLDLVSGDVSLSFAPDYVTSSNWLRGADTLVGRWLDRYTMRG